MGYGPRGHKELDTAKVIEHARTVLESLPASAKHVLCCAQSLGRV